MTAHQLEVERGIEVEAQSLTVRNLTDRDSSLGQPARQLVVAAKVGQAAEDSGVTHGQHIGRRTIVGEGATLARCRDVDERPDVRIGRERNRSGPQEDEACSRLQRSKDGLEARSERQGIRRPTVDLDVFCPGGAKPLGEIIGGERPGPGQEARQLADMVARFEVQDSDRGSSHGVTLAHTTEEDLAEVLAYIGLGANVGDARQTLTAGVATLSSLPGAHLRGVSSLYRTTPVGVTDQPDFLNAVAALDVPAGPSPGEGATAVLVALKAIERDAGRQRRERWGPRELDLDLLLFGDNRIAIERPPEGQPLSALADPAAAGRLLEVPHPQMRDRLFVLAPLADLAPDLVPPGWEETIDAARRRRSAVEGRGAVRLAGSWSATERGWILPTGGPITIDRPRLEEADEVARVHTAAASAGYRDIAPPDPGGLARRTAMWREVLGKADHGAFVARDRNRIVGILGIGGFRGKESIAAISVLYVLPAWWGSGVAQLLIERAHHELANSHDEAVLSVLTQNARARRFYERNGWVEGETLVEDHFGHVPTQVTRYRRALP
jgi:2-amino-4-hydroxy-6-hydroxymethyldihydropteridine diphosphokinase